MRYKGNSMTKNNSFTDEERAAWHEDRRREKLGDAGARVPSVNGDTCINCGHPLGRALPDGYEAALCDACD